MVQFLSINFFSWISSIFVGFFKSSFFLYHPVLVTGPSSSCKVFCSSIAYLLVSLVFLVLWFPFSKICHIVLPADLPASSPLTLAYRCPSRIFPLPFRYNPLAKSPSSIQLFGSTKVSPKALATQSNLSLSAPKTPPWHISTSQHSTQAKSAVRKFHLSLRHQRIYFSKI